MARLSGLLLACGLALSGMAQAAEVVINSTDLRPVAPGLSVVQTLSLPPEDKSLPIVAETDGSDAARLLRQFDGRGVAAGFGGWVYDNRDREHSSFGAGAFPRLIRLRYGFELMADDIDNGLARHIILPVPVLGNSSTAVTGGPGARSMTRLAMTTGLGRNHAVLQYNANHLYIYPEHRDHDAVDLFPMNWPYTLTSQGSSGSDRSFFRAIAQTLAAFRPETFAALRDARLLAPTLQMILRRNSTAVQRAEDFYTGAAHPMVFDGNMLRPGRMVGHAAAMKPDEIPPVVRLAVVEEDFKGSAGLAGLSEDLLTSPSAIGRIWRGVEGRRAITLSAEATEDPNGRALTFRWVLLRGDPARVRITPQGARGEAARIEVDWHDPFSVARTPGSEERIETSRVDIGVFAENGAHPSAPAILSIDFPAHQRRTYEDGPDGPRLVSIDYDAAAREIYFDPILHWTAPWTDTARRNSEGQLIGWSRRYADGTSAEIGADLAYEIDTSNQRRPTLRLLP